MAQQGGRRPLAAVAASGLIWMSVAALLAKFASMINQVVLGYLIDVETYGTFAIVAVAVSMVAGLQNSGVSKILIQQECRDAEIVDEYTKFCVYSGLLGGVFLIFLSCGMAWIYKMPNLVPIISISALSVPFAAIATIFVAKASIDHRFRELALVDTWFSLVYSAAVISLAYIGFDYYTISVATCIAWGAKFLIYTRYFNKINFRATVSPKRFFIIFGKVKWIMFASFLFGLSQQGAYLVLGRMLDRIELGFFYFGFMLTANVGMLITQGIAGALMPVFSTMRTDVESLRKALFRVSAAISFVCGAISIAMVGMAPSLVHLIWGGKWDSSLLVAIVMAISLPTRILSSLGAIVLEARGFWRSRTLILILDVIGMMVSAGVGAALGGLEGAAIGAGLQRVVYGLLVFMVGGLHVEPIASRLWLLVARVTIPFVGAVAILYWFRPALHVPREGLFGAVLSSGETSIAMFTFILLTAVFNRKSLSDLSGFLFEKLRRAPR